jgi:hypothetical protein
MEVRLSIYFVPVDATEHSMGDSNQPVDTHWLQLYGTAMGTPVACSYAMLSFSHHKYTSILTEFQPNYYFIKGTSMTYWVSGSLLKITTQQTGIDSRKN